MGNTPRPDGPYADNVSLVTAADMNRIEGNTADAHNRLDGLPFRAENVNTTGAASGSVSALLKKPDGGYSLVEPVGPVAASDFVNSWWCVPRSKYSALRGCVYQGGIDAQGTIYVARLDLRRRTAEKFRLGTFEIDDHNVSSFLIEDDKPPLVAYVRHGYENFVRIRSGTVPHDLGTLGAEQQVAFPGTCTYAHLHRRPGTNTVALLTRNTDGWYLRVSTDYGATWSAAQRFHGLSYCTFNVVDGVAHYAITNHPTEGTDVPLYKLRISLATGVIYNEAGTVIDNLWDFSGTVIPSASMTYVRKCYDTDAVYNSHRVFDVLSDGSVLAMRLNKATPEQGGQYGVYRRATTGATPSSSQGIDAAGRGWTWEPIVLSGLPVGYYQSSYVGGMSAGANQDEAYVAREASGTWTFERWTKTSGTWAKQETLLTRTDGRKLGRPQVPWGAYGTGLFTGVEYYAYSTSDFKSYYGDQIIRETGVQSATPAKDITAPGAPTSPTATPGTNQATLSWTASSGDPIAYEVYDGATRLKTVTGTSHTVTGLTAGQAYANYAVRALDAAGNASALTAFPSVTPTGSAPTQDPILTTGSLLLVDPTNSFGAWNAGVPADGAAVPNLVPSGFAVAAANSLTGADGVVERTSKGALHAIVSQSTGAGNRAFRLTSEQLRAYLAANTAHAFYISLWAAVSRLSIETTPGAPSRFLGVISSSNADLQGARLASGNKLTVAPSANRTNIVESATPVPLDTPTRVAAAHSAIGTPSTSDPTVVLMGNWAASVAVNKNASWTLYRAYVEDLTVSGRTFAQVETIDQQLYAAAFGTGGRYTGDTHTAVSTLP